MDDVPFDILLYHILHVQTVFYQHRLVLLTSFNCKRPCGCNIVVVIFKCSVGPPSESRILMCITVIKIFVMISFIPPHVIRILLFLFTNKPYEGVRCSLGEDFTVLSCLCLLRHQPDALVPGWHGPMFLERLAPSAPGVGSDYSLDSRHCAEYFRTQWGARAELNYACACAQGLFEWPCPPNLV